MNRNRAPKGIPTGGQFTAAEHAEPTSPMRPALARADKAVEAGKAKSTTPMRPALARADKALTAVEGFADYVESRHQREMDEIRASPIIWRDLLPRFLRRKRT